MRPTALTEAEVWQGAELAVFGGPPGHEDSVQPVAAIVDVSKSTGLHRASVRMELEPGDLDKLTAGGHVWLTFYGAMIPWSVDVTAPGEIGSEVTRDAAPGE